MSFIRSLITDLRERQVLPAVILLVVLVVAIPVFGGMLLSGSGTPAPVSVPPVETAPPKGEPAPTTELATVQTPPVQHSVLYKGSEPNPFAAVSSPSSSSSSSSSSASHSTSSSSTGSGSTSSSSGSGSSTPKPTITPAKGSSGSSGTSTSSGSAPSSLASDQVYTADITTSYGSETDELKNVERLTPLPANVTGEVVFLGVMKGGKLAAFAFTGAVPVKATTLGSTVCEPSAGECGVIELPVGAKLTLTPSPANPSYSTFTLEVSAIGAAKLASVSAATQAREATSTAGQAIVSASTSSVLASFFYNVSTGALVYEAQTAVGTTGSSGTSGSSGASGSSGSSGLAGLPVAAG